MLRLTVNRTSSSVKNNNELLEFTRVIVVWSPWSHSLNRSRSALFISSRVNSATKTSGLHYFIFHTIYGQHVLQYLMNGFNICTYHVANCSLFESIFLSMLALDKKTMEALVLVMLCSSLIYDWLHTDIFL